MKKSWVNKLKAGDKVIADSSTPRFKRSVFTVKKITRDFITISNGWVFKKSSCCHKDDLAGNWFSRYIYEYSSEEDLKNKELMLTNELAGKLRGVNWALIDLPILKKVSDIIDNKEKGDNTICQTKRR